MEVQSMSNLNFTRALPVTYYGFSNDEAENKAAKEAARLMSPEAKPSMFDEGTSRKIGEFLRAQIGDYDKNGAVLVNIDGRPCLCTGKEAVMAREIEKQAEDEEQSIRDKYAALNSKTKSKNKLMKNKQNMQNELMIMKVDKGSELFKMAENGQNNKPFTELSFTMDGNKLQKIAYYSINPEEIDDGKCGRTFEFMEV